MSVPSSGPPVCSARSYGAAARGAGAREPAARDLALHLGVLPEARAALGGVDRDHQLLPRPQRQRLGDHLVDRDHAGLGAEDVVVGRLQPPQRPQPERVGREHALVVVAGDQRHRALGERAHRLAQVHVERVQLGGQRADLVDHRGDDSSIASASESPSTRIRWSIVRLRSIESEPPAGIVDAERPRLLAQLLDRVDLAVVAEDRERLHAAERGPGVGRVAVVAEAGDGLEALVGEVRVVGAEHLRRAHHLVDAGRRRERGHVEAELGLELAGEREQGPVAVLGRGEQPADLPEVRLLLARGCAQRLRLDRPEALGEDPQAGAPEQLAGAVQARPRRPRSAR